MAREELAVKNRENGSLVLFLLGISGWDCVTERRNEHLEYDGSLEFLDYAEKQEVEQEILPEHEKKFYCLWYLKCILGIQTSGNSRCFYPKLFWQSPVLYTS